MRYSGSILLVLVLNIYADILNARDQEKTDSLLHALQRHEAKKAEAGKQFNALQDSTKVLLMYDLFNCYQILEEVVKCDSLADSCMNLATRINYKKGIGIGYHCLGWKISRSDPELGLTYYQKAVRIRNEADDLLGVVRSSLNLAWMYHVTGQQDSAFAVNRRAIHLAELHHFSEQLAAGYHNHGMYYSMNENIIESCKYYLKAKLINEQPGGRKDYLWRNLHRLSFNLLLIGRYKDALSYGKQGVEICKYLGLKLPEAQILSECVAPSYEGLQKHDSAISCFHQAAEFFKNFGDPDALTVLYINMADAFLAMRDYKNALTYGLLSYNSRDPDNGSNAMPVLNIALSYANLHQFREAMPFAQKSLHFARFFKRNDLFSGTYKALSIIYFDMGNYKLANHYEKLYGQYFDSIFNAKNMDLALKHQLNYEYERRELQDKNFQDKKDALARQELERQKLVRNGFLGGSVVILLFAGIFFIQRNQIRKGKERSEELLLNILPAEIADELKTQGKASTRNFDLATILFTDFKDFTEISSRMSGEDLVHEINHCFKGFDHIIEKYGLEKIKTIGDAYMAVGGVPSPAKDSVRNTILAGLEMQSFIEARREENSQTGKQAFAMRLGIHTGPVVAGIVGVKKFQYDLWGDTVDIAQLMEKSGTAGMVVISGDTYHLVRDDLELTFEIAGTVQLNDDSDMATWFVHRHSSFRQIAGQVIAAN